MMMMAAMKVIPSYFPTKVWHPNVDHKTGEVCLVDIPPSLLLIKILIHYQVGEGRN